MSEEDKKDLSQFDNVEMFGEYDHCGCIPGGLKSQNEGVPDDELDWVKYEDFYALRKLADDLAKQLAKAREDALREALATIADLKAWPNAMYDDEAIMCGHEEAYRAIEKRIKEKTK